ncbi:MAG: CBS domain-containing protein [Tatlockia sp.]|nr:CBS domain-containing protein [Tatlockia sp.]
MFYQNTLDPDDELLQASVVLITKNIRRLSVLKNKKLIGTLSRTDICKALLTYSFNSKALKK